jgi:hypothetical protein
MTLIGYMGKVDNPKELVDVSRQVRQSGYSKFDTFSPFPIHGIDKAMEIPASKLPWLSITGCFIGLTAALALQIWTNGIDYKIALSGKPYAAIPAFIPVTFELTILFTAFFTVFGMFALNKLPMWNRPEFNIESFKKVTCNGFFISIYAIDNNFDETKTLKFLKKIGITEIERIEDIK